MLPADSTCPVARRRLMESTTFKKIPNAKQINASLKAIFKPIQTLKKNVRKPQRLLLWHPPPPQPQPAPPDPGLVPGRAHAHRAPRSAGPAYAGECALQEGEVREHDPKEWRLQRQELGSLAGCTTAHARCYVSLQHTTARATL